MVYTSGARKNRLALPLNFVQAERPPSDVGDEDAENAPEGAAARPAQFVWDTHLDYISTRGDAPSLGFRDALLAGLASDGGLYLPREWPALSRKDIRAMRGKSYQEIAFQVISIFVDGDIPDDDLRGMIDEAYATFRHPAVAPLGRRVRTTSCSNFSTARRWPSRMWQCSCSPA